MENQHQDSEKTMGRGMMFAAWIIGLALATYLVDNWLDNKHNPNQNLSSNKTQPVVLQQNSRGHYVASGMINGVAVVFLLDTGATNVVVGEELAKQLGLQRRGKVQVSTANGVITAWRTELKTVSLGGLQARNIKALINPYATDNTVLLGMSFLKHLRLVQNQNTLSLSAP